MSDTPFRQLVESVRATASIRAVVERDVALVQAGSVLKGLSPFTPEKTPSFIVRPESGRWHDYAGGRDEGGDVFDYVQRRRGISFVDAVLALASEYGVPVDSRSRETPPPEVNELLERRNLERVLTIAAGYYHRVLPGRIRTSWLHERYGFSDGTINDFQIGWADGHLVDHFDGKEFSPEFLSRTGLFTLRAGALSDFFVDRIVFPYWRGGRVVYFIARATEHTGDENWEKAKYKKLPTRSERASYISPLIENSAFYNEDAARGAETLLITEGVTDCIAAVQAGVACISPVTTRFRRKDTPRLVELTLGAERVVICNDAESSGAGEAGARETAGALYAHGRDVRIAELPRPDGVDKIDINEFLRDRGAEALREVLEAAVPFDRFVLDRLPKDCTPEDRDAALEPFLQRIARRPEQERGPAIEDLIARYRFPRKRLTRRIGQIAADEARAELERDHAARGRQIVVVSGRSTEALIAEAASVLVSATRDGVRTGADADLAALSPTMIFRSSHGLTRLVMAGPDRPEMQACRDDVVFGALVRRATWVAESSSGPPTPASPPRSVVRDLVINPPEGLPRLETLQETPVFGASGRLLIERGYHADDACWVEPGTLEDVEVSDTPTRDEVATAVSFLLDDVVGDFPFASQADRANCLAMFLLPFARRLFTGCTPLHVIEAPTPGSGKGYLAKVLGAMVVGRDIATSALPSDDDEIRKRLTAIFIAGDPIVVLDNVDNAGVLGSPALAAAITSDPYRDRILGQSAMVAFPNRVTWVMTANNPTFNADVVRRTIRIRLDAKSMRPHERTGFRHDPIIPWVIANRAKAVQACLTIVRHWLVSGRAPGTRVVGSFESWSRTIGGVLAAAAVSGFLDNQDEHRARSDAESDEWSELFWFWWDKWGPTEVRASDVAELCHERQLLLHVRGMGSERSVASRVGRALVNAEDRFFGQWQVRRGRSERGGSSLYRLTRTVEQAPGASTSNGPTASASPRTEVDPFA